MGKGYDLYRYSGSIGVDSLGGSLIGLQGLYKGNISGGN